MNKNVTWMGIAAFALTVASGQGAVQPWTVTMQTENGACVLTVFNATVSATLAERVYWTLTDIRYDNEQLVGTTGANGAVASVWYTQEDGTKKSQWMGTGHDLEELHDFTVVIDGKPVELKPDEKAVGRIVTVTKRSTMGPVDQTAEIVFPETGDRLVEHHRFTPNGASSLELNILYAFMHCNVNALTKWRAWKSPTAFEDASCDLDNNAFLLKQDILAISFYSPALGLGLSYVYPEVYEGAHIRNSIWDRPRDNKLYFSCKDPNIPAGDDTVWEYHLEVIPFRATQTEWENRVDP